MQRLVIIVLIILAVIAITPLFIDIRGYVLIALGDFNIEFSVFAGIVMLTILIISILAALKVFKGGLRLGFGTWNKIAYASRRRGQRDFNKGLACFALGDYKQAEHLLARSAQPSQNEDTAYLLAATAAQNQSLSANTKHYLQAIDDNKGTIKNLGLDSILVRVKLLLSQKANKDARTLIDQYHKHIGHDARLLSLEIDLCLTEQRFETAIDYLVSARKQKAIDESKIEQWEDTAFYQQFNKLMLTQDHNATHEFWQKQSRKIKHRESVIFAYAKVLAEHKITAPLNDILLPAIKKEASEQFLNRVKQLPLSNTEELITAVQKHLHKNASSAKWLSTLGHLALAGEQYSMAEKVFNSLTNLPDSPYNKEDLVAFAKTLSAQQNHLAANQLYAKIVALN